MLTLAQTVDLPPPTTLQKVIFYTSLGVVGVGAVVLLGVFARDAHEDVSRRWGIRKERREIERWKKNRKNP